MCNLTIYWKIFHRKSENVYLKFDRDSAILSCDNDDLKSRYKSFLQFIVFYLLQWIRTGKKRKRLRKKSHILVARYLADQMPATKSLQSHRKAFCLGSILPDIKPSFLTKKQYEKHLKNHLKRYIESGAADRMVILPVNFGSFRELVEYIGNAHERYLLKERNIAEDVQYILRICSQVIHGILQLAAKQFGREDILIPAAC